jgi:oxygen-dependent protoporphyrinogen oxidase
MRICIIGGGSAGLSAAWTLEKARRQGAALEYRLFERSSRLGGVIQTEILPDGSLLEAGPDSFITEKPWAASLCQELGLGEQLVGSNDGTRSTFILQRGGLAPLPDGLQFLVPTKTAPILSTPLFSVGTKLRFLREFLFPPSTHQTEDESVAAFVTRHFGEEMVERLADPLLAGIYGGSASQLSVQAVLPRMTKMEADHRSLIRAVLRARKSAAQTTAPPRPLFSSLRGGMQQMTHTLAAQLRPEWISTSTEVRAIERSGQAWRMSTAAGATDFDGVILALPAWAAGLLLRDIDPQLADQLAAIPYSSSITVNLVYEQQSFGRRLQGFGFLVPRSEGRKLLACTYTHNKFPHRAAPGKAILRCFLAAEQADAAMSHSDEEIVSTITAELRDILEIKVNPELARVSRWPRAMAQYAVGHLARVAAIEQQVAAMPGLALAGNGYHGIGVPDCVRSGAEAAGRLLSLAGATAVTRQAVSQEQIRS